MSHITPIQRLYKVSLNSVHFILMPDPKMMADDGVDSNNNSSLEAYRDLDVTLGVYQVDNDNGFSLDVEFDVDSLLYPWASDEYNGFTIDVTPDHYAGMGVSKEINLCRMVDGFAINATCHLEFKVKAMDDAWNGVVLQTSSANFRQPCYH